jgi:DNA replication protein DnaC
MTAPVYPIPSRIPPIVNQELERWRERLAEVPEADRAARWAEIVEDACSELPRLDSYEIPRAYRDASPDKARDPDAFNRALAHPGTKTAKPGLILFGDTGSGKTSAAYARIIRRLLGHEFITHVSATDLALMVRGSASNFIEFSRILRFLCGRDTEEDTETDDDVTARWFSCSGLLIDDLHVPRFTDAYARTLYQIIEARTADRDELILTCQTDAVGLLRKWRADAPELADTAKAIVRRITDHCTPINFVWEDSPWA